MERSYLEASKVEGLRNIVEGGRVRSDEVLKGVGEKRTLIGTGMGRGNSMVGHRVE